MADGNMTSSTNQSVAFAVVHVYTSRILLVNNKDIEGDM